MFCQNIVIFIVSQFIINVNMFTIILIIIHKFVIIFLVIQANSNLRYHLC